MLPPGHRVRPVLWEEVKDQARILGMGPVLRDPEVGRRTRLVAQVGGEGENGLRAAAVRWGLLPLSGSVASICASFHPFIYCIFKEHLPYTGTALSARYVSLRKETTPDVCPCGVDIWQPK